MKIRKAIKVAVTGAVFALPAVTMAAAPNPSNFTYDGSDNVTATSGGLTCSATAGGEAGFLQRQCTDGTDTFIQTIIVENGTEGLFTDSNVVMTGGNNGIADINHINDSGFDTNAQIQTGTLGSANTLGLGTNHLGVTVFIDIAQGVTDTTGANETMTSTFGLTEDANESQTIAINQALDNTTSGEEFSQSFDHFERNAALGGSTDTNGNSVTFDAGDFLATSLINQDVTGVGIFSLQDFADEAWDGGTGVDSLVSSGPHYSVTYTGGADVFPAPLGTASP